MTSRFADKFLIESSRLNNWDYSNPGIYFITICTYNHNNFFGKIENNQMVLSDKGEIVKQEILKTIKIRKNVTIDPWVIMPNHVHLLITIRDLPVETPGRHEISWAVGRQVVTIWRSGTPAAAMASAAKKIVEPESR